MKRLSQILIVFILIVSLVPFSVGAKENPLTPEEALEALRKGMCSRQTEITLHFDVSDPDWSELPNELWDHVFDHTGVPTEGDYLHWHYGGMSYGLDPMSATLNYSIAYYTTAAQEAELDVKFQQVMSSLNLNGKSDYEKVKAIQDYITANVSYDHEHLNQNYPLMFTAYAALVNGTAVCQGYTNLFYRMALDAGLDCRIITGTGNGGGHAWNIVRINGIYYNIDPTWNENTDSYMYFLKGSANFTDHITDSEYLTPEFTAQYPISQTDYDPAANHKNLSLKNAVEPGCTTQGYSGDWICDDCGEIVTKGNTLAATGHTEVTDPAKYATCTSTGLTEGKHCSVCNAVLVAQETIPMKDHSWNSGTVTEEPTLDQEGQKTYTCQTCGKTKTEAIPALRGSFLKIDRQDTILSKKYAVKNPKTDTQQSFSYTTPENGVTMLVFFSNQCGNSRSLMQQLDGCKWMSNPYLNVVAVESVASSAPPVMDFISTQTPNTAPLIDYFYAGDAKLAFSYYRLFSDKSSLTWPVVLLITDDGFVRYGTDAATSITDIYNILGCISPAFAAYEAGEDPEKPEEPSEPESDICTLQVAGMREYDEIQEVFRLLNEQRTQNGLEPLILDATITELAMQRAAECALYYSHTRPNGGSCFTIIEENGIQVWSAGENIAAGYYTAADVMDGWMNSSGHRENILTSGYTHAGLGCVTVNAVRYWVQLFVSGPSSTENDAATGQCKFVAPVSAFKVLAGTHSAESKTYTIAHDQLGTYTDRFCVSTVNSGFSWAYTALIPILGDATDSSGKIIATITSADDGTGELIITPMAIGTGTVTLPLYEGEQDPLVLTITVNDTCKHASTSTINEKAPTCTQEGYSGDVVCSDCNETVTKGSAIPATGHKWDEGTVTTDPTEDAEGVRTFTCTNGCGEIKTESIPKLEIPDEPCTHTNTATINEKAPTCTQEGYSGDTVCNDCKETITKGTAVPATGHKWDDGTVTTEPTEDTEGVKTFTCTNGCGETKTESLPKLEIPDEPCTHTNTATVNAKAPTCTQEGYSGDVVCSDCSETVTKGTAIPATGHTWDDGTVTTEPTEDSEGVRTFTCTNGCGETRTEAISALPRSGFTRLAGANRFETAFAVADALKATLGVEKFDSIIVASGTNFADALSGSYLASVKNAPILLSYNTADINNAVKDYIRANLKSGGTVYILGGTNAVPAGMEQGLNGFTIRRLAGADRFGTNLAILAEAGVAGKDVLICTGADFADSLSASAAKLPILLVWKELTLAQKGFLQTVDGNLYVIGGTSAVSDSLMNQLKEFGKPIRLGGSNRFETSVLIAKTFFPSAQEAVLAYAWNFPDGLCGGPLAAAMDAPLILTMTCYEEAAADYTTSRKINRGYVLGSENLIPESSIEAIMGEATAGHAYISQANDPTCLEIGYTTHTCYKCQKTYTDAKIAALGHDFEKTIVTPTFEEGGYTLSTCKVCGHTKYSDRVGALDPALKEVWELVNEVRAQAGLQPLTYCFDGQKAGDIRAGELLTNFSHTRPNGTECFTALKETGLAFSGAWEIIGQGYPNAEALVDNWMNSSDTLMILLNPIPDAGLIVGKNGSTWVMFVVY